MKKKIIILCAAMLFLMLFRQTVSAETTNGGRAEILSAYCLEKKLYTFVGFAPDCQPEKLDGNKLSGAGIIEEKSSPVSLASTDTTVHYVMMIDLSTSMRNYIGMVNRLIDGLAEAGAQKVVFSVLTFGDKLEVVSEKLDEPDKLREVVQNLQYNAMLTDPYEGIGNAIDYLSTVPCVRGELVNLVLVTDGAIYLGDISVEQRRTIEAEKAQKTLEKIENTPEIILHTLCVGEWEELAYQTFSKGTGVDISVNGSEPYLSAQELVKFVNDLYRLDFYHDGEEPRFDIRLQFVGEEDGMRLSLNSERKSVPVIGAEQPETEEGGDSAPSDPQDGNEADTAETGNVLQEKDEKSVCIDRADIIVFMTVAIVLLIAAIVIYVMKRERIREKTESLAAQTWNIHMKIEVLSGNIRNMEKQICLQDQILIGRSRMCDLVWSDRCVSKKNSRIYIKDQTIYIEDLNSKEGTALGGMRLYAPNPLRSGDVISIGAVSFILRF